MQFHNLKRNKANKKAKQVGRGGTRGKTSGRGTKGQNARSGHKKRPEMRDVIKRMPKLRGRGKNSLKTRKEEFFPINISIIESNFKASEVVSPKTLFEKGLVAERNGKVPRIKILGKSAEKNNFKFEKVKVSGIKVYDKS